MASSTEAVTRQASNTKWAAACAKLMEESNGNVLGGLDQFPAFADSQFGWIDSRCAEFNTPDTHAFAGAAAGFDDLVDTDFKVSAPDEQGTVPLIADRFGEIKQLIPVIEESHGETFVAFRDQFLQKLDVSWVNQAYIAQTLAAVPKVEAKLYEAGRQDVIAVAARAHERFNMICAREGGEEPLFPNESTTLSTAGVVLGIIGVTSQTLSGPAGWLGLAVGIASLGANDDPVKVPATGVEGVNGHFEITGETTDDVCYSLRNALTRIELLMSDAESKIIEAVNEVVWAVQGEGRRDVVAPEVAFPK